MEKYTTPFFTLLIVGMVGLVPVTLAFAFSKNVQRHPTLINLCISYIVYALSYCILIFTGQQRDARSPPTIACRVQSSSYILPSILASDIAYRTTMAALGVLVHLWLTFNDPLQSLPSGKWPRSIYLTISLVLPYIAFVAFGLAAAILGIRDPSSVNAANGLYCDIVRGPFRRFGVPLFCAIVLAFIVVFEVAIGVRFYHSWTHVTRVFPLANRQPSVSMAIRIFIFSIYSVVTFCAAVFLIAGAVSPWLYFVIASVPLAAFVIFGTHYVSIHLQQSLSPSQLILFD
ncbi:hypothetical protein FISHEDRAFT_37512 [Fistulina hepatica ATCC 64428]|uniref:G-protein coupled receptors family 1 profile domain-containing protein n=1 Tax=Fistulina hepatica ATCC 64428 TaxID=1128425 RepID=A0A0D7AKI2_9AGAR|nr:hypothetical protein FISHEDRAFT_37512 [Fistulina hepatica ATCC 64428]